MRHLFASISLILLISSLLFSCSHQKPSSQKLINKAAPGKMNSEEKRFCTLGLGRKKNPIKCDGVKGEQEYLGRVLCPDNKAVLYLRIGSTRLKSGGHVIDRYKLTCEDQSHEITVYMDMYFPGFIEKNTRLDWFSGRK